MHELGWKQLTQSVDDDYYTLCQMAASLTDEEFEPVRFAEKVMVESTVR
jgi:hypothetical protein